MKRSYLIIILVWCSCTYAQISSIDVNQPSLYKDQLPRLYNNWSYLFNGWTDPNVAGITAAIGSVNVYNVKSADYGAVGDGATDDQSAVQAAMTAAKTAGGGTVYFPDGDYLIGSQLTLTACENIRLTGSKYARISFDNIDQGIAFTDVNNLTIDNLTFEGTTARLLMFIDVNDLRIHDCDISGVTKTPASSCVCPIYLNGITRGWIERNYLHNCGNAAVLSEGIGTYTNTTPTTKLHVNDNIISNADAGNIHYGIFLEGTDCTVSRNYIDLNYKTLDADSDGYGVAFYAAGSLERNVISNNTIIRTAGCGIYSVGEGSENFVVADNMLEDVCKTQSDASLEVAAISLDQCFGGTISGNRIKLSGKDGIGMTNCENMACNGNSIEDVNQYGIRIRDIDDCNNIVISGGSVEDTEYYGVYINPVGRVHDLTITGVIVRDTATGGALWVSDANNAIIANCVIDGSALDGIRINAGENNIISNNRVTGVLANNSIRYAGEYGLVTGNQLFGNDVGVNLDSDTVYYGNRDEDGAPALFGNDTNGLTVSADGVLAQVGNAYFDGNIKINTTTSPTANGGGVLVMGLVDANSVTLGTNTAGFYVDDVAASAEMMVMDEADNETQISPHDPVTGEWIFYSQNKRTGQVKRVNMEALVRAVEKLTGEQFMFDDYMEGRLKEY